MHRAVAGRAYEWAVVVGLLSAALGACGGNAGPGASAPRMTFEILDTSGHPLGRASTLSADGALAGGSDSGAALPSALLWDEAGVLRTLPHASARPRGSSILRALSADGRVTAGGSSNDSTDLLQPVIWQLPAGVTRFLMLPANTLGGIVTAISADGSTLAGPVTRLGAGASGEAVIWVSPEGAPQTSGFDTVHALSPDGRRAAVCCTVVQGPSLSLTDAILDVASGETNAVPLPVGFDVCAVTALSDTGDLVGTCSTRAVAGTEPRSVPVIWHDQNPEVVGAIAGQQSGALTGISAAGDLAGGYAGVDPFGFEAAHAIVWRPGSGAERLAELLQHGGAAPAAAYHLNAVLAVSGDGTALLGVAFDRRDPDRRPLPFRVRGLAPAG